MAGRPNIKPGHILLWVLFLIADVGIALGIAEAWVRAFIPVKDVCYFVDDKIGVRYCPDQAGYGHVQPGYSNPLRTNHLGFHDIERTPGKKQGAFRIHVYGDSMIAGLGVPIDRTIPSLLEQELQGQGYGGVEVLNMASGAESTGAQLVTYEEIGRHFDPDLVLLMFMDDFGDNVLELSGNRYAAYFRLDEKDDLVYYPPAAKNTSTLVYRMKRRLHFYSLVKNKMLESKLFHDGRNLFRELMNRKSAKDTSVGNGEDYPALRKRLYIEESWPLTLRIIEVFRDKVEKQGARFVLVDGRTFDENIGTVYQNEDLETFCREKGIDYLPGYTVLDRMASSGDPGEYFLNDGHPTVKGNREISRFLADRVNALLYTAGPSGREGNRT